MVDHEYQSPIVGMDDETFQKVFDENFADEIQEASGLKSMAHIERKMVSEKKQEHICSVCMVAYEPGTKIFVLPCRHHFHSDCIRPWFAQAHACPVCRFDLNANAHSID